MCLQQTWADFMKEKPVVWISKANVSSLVRKGWGGKGRTVKL